MEGAPFKPEDDSEKTEPSGKKKKVETFGSFLVEPKSEAKAESAEDSRNFLEKLFKGDDEPTAVEQAEAELPIDETTPTEEQVIAEHLVAAQPEPLVESEEAGAIEEAEAIETFRDKIISEHKDADTALAETFDELDIQEPAVLSMDKGDEQIIDLANQPPKVEVEEEKPTIADGNGRQTPPPLRPTAGGFNFGAGGSARPNVLAVPTAAAAGVASRPEYVMVNNESDAVGAALLGGIIGYLIGRRRGRIKTEKRLRPVQKKLEKRVGELQQDLIAKEIRIRRVIRQQIRQKQQVNRLERSDRQLHQRTLKVEKAVRRVVAPEASRLHGATSYPEHLGKVIIGAEALSVARPSKVETLPVVSRRIENLSRGELLAASQNIPVEHSNLRQIYETHLVSEQGLRRLVETHQQGGDLKQALRREITEHDIDFERDPLFRDRRRQATVANSTSTASVSALVARVTSDDRAQDEVAVLHARAAYETAQQLRYHNRRQMVDIGLVGTIMILAASVIILLLSRS